MMNSIDFTPLYRNSAGFDHLATLINSAMRTDTGRDKYPPYNIEKLEDNHYAITLAVAGFMDNELEIDVEKGVLTIRGKKADDQESDYLYQGIAVAPFESKFSLADFIEVIDAEYNNGLLKINLIREIPEAMKPKKISINQKSQMIEHKAQEKTSVAA